MKYFSKISPAASSASIFILVAIFMAVLKPESLQYEASSSKKALLESYYDSEQGEEGLEVNGVRYDGYEKYAYVMEAFRRGQVDINASAKYPTYKPGYLQQEIQSAYARRARARTASVDATFIERGPVNLPGRTRSIVVDAGDASEQTWFAGAVGGGIWKTTNAGLNWIELTADQPNIAIASLAQSPANPDVLYGGTGEKAFTGISASNGQGILKSTDGGDTWAFIPSTNTVQFANVNRIIVNPEDENTLLVATSENRYFDDDPGTNHIYKSTDGGVSWEETYTSNFVIGQLIFQPDDFNIQYAAINNGTVLKSTDGGESWGTPVKIKISPIDSETGTFDLLENPDIGRIELAIAHQNHDMLYASLNTGLSELYVSYNAGETWVKCIEPSETRSLDWLGGQGNYDNTIMVSPLNDSLVYMGGVNMESFRLGTIQTTDSVRALDPVLEGTDGIIEVWNLFTDEGVEITTDEFSSVEIRFGVSQRAHRFTVPEGSTSGVPAEDYKYENYVNVPFQVWDVENNQQLMVSWRDNNQNGVFDLNDDPNSSREYIFVNQIPYVDKADDRITEDGGYQFRNTYLVWLVTPENVGWNENNISGATIGLSLSQKIFSQVRGNYVVVANAYQFGPGGYVGPNHVLDFHVDHHQLLPINISEDAFTILNTNDGGVFVSDTSDTPGRREQAFTMRSNGYNTTTYYGADMAPDTEEFFAGAQDRGTHLSTNGESASSITEYTEVIFGDGFETIWHVSDPDQLIGGSQFNGLGRSDDGGETFVPADFGLQDDGPFVTRLSNSYIDQDLLFAVGGSGVYRSNNFGRNWTYSIIDDERWSFWSGADVEVSQADPQIVWAGGGMIEGDFPFNIFVSHDGGFEFEATNNFDDLGVSTGIYSHPFERETAYVLFAVANQAKILKTTDLGQTWEDITQFENGESLNGFPDVSVYSLLVMPYDTDIIWAGTEIGIVESFDGGETWALRSDPNFRAVNVWDMKVKGDKVVLATHGRGVWTATIPELANASTPQPVLGPVLNSLGQSTEEFTMLVNTELRAVYDSLEVYFDDELVVLLPGNDSVGIETIRIDMEETGTYNVHVEAVKDGIRYRTAELSIIISPFFPVQDGYSNTFEETNDDFTLDRFNISGQTGFSSGILHTVHPYPEGSALGTNEVNLTAKLNIPIRVAEEDAFIRFREVVIVETGEDGSEFGDEEFWDYVIVEGSLDGATWVPLLDGYDASANDTWEGLYLGQGNGSEQHFQPREINILDTFNPGDVIQIRFRLFSDPFAAGWGWAIDNLYIQEEPVISGVNDPEIASKVSIYPNPSFGLVNLELQNVLNGQVQLRVIDYSGRNMLEQRFVNRTGTLNDHIDLSALPMGIYVIELNNGSDRVTKKILKF